MPHLAQCVDAALLDGRKHSLLGAQPPLLQRLHALRGTRLRHQRGSVDQLILSVLFNTAQTYL
jgi:hypothetical protein